MADKWNIYDGKIVLIVLPHLKLQWSINLGSGNADVELRKGQELIHARVGE